MKKLLLVLFFAASVSAQGQTSVYHPFPDSGAVWIMNWTHWCTNSSIGCLLGCGSNYQYRVDGDTLISGNAYKKVIKESYLKYCSCMVVSPPNPWGTPTCNQYPFDAYFFRGIRNDSANKIVYVTDGTVEDTLYNFNINVNDTIYGRGGTVVTGIDSVLVGATFRKSFTTDYAGVWQGRIIEGIGDVTALFGGPFDSWGPCACDNMWGFSCFMENGNVLYGNSSCSLVTSDGNISTENNSVLLSPNPATNQLTISSRQWAIKEIEIYDVMGEKQIALPLNPLKGTSVSIDVSGLSAGIYFVRVSGAKARSVVKFVKE